MPAGAIDLQQAMRVWRHGAADLLEMLVHGCNVDRRHDQARPDAPRGADGAKQIGPAIASVARLRRPTAAARPDTRQRALLTNPGLVPPPDFQRLAARLGRQRFIDQRGKVFVCACWRARSRSGWNGRAVSLRNPGFFKSLPTLRSR
jgi:hypothetical protein